MNLIYLSPVTWSSFSQRPHEFVRYFRMRTGGNVLWVDPYPTRFPILLDLLNSRPKSDATGCVVPNWLTVVKPKALPIEPLPFSGEVNRLFWGHVVSEIRSFAKNSTLLGIGKPSMLALQLLSKGLFAFSFYDAMDDFPAFYNGWSRLSMAIRERKTVHSVSTVLTSSSSLWKRLKRLKSDVRLVPNACASDRLPEIPRLRPLGNNQAAVICYIGTIGHWFDWGIVLALAESHPQARFRLIGPLYAQPSRSLPENVSLESTLPHAEALQAMTQCDVGLIPFKRNRLTSSVDPIKFYEYRAMGLPVVSSAFGEMALRDESDGVYLVDKTSDMTQVIANALACGRTPSSIEEFRENNSWEARFDQANIFSL